MISQPHFKRNTMKKDVIITITGPTNSGKSRIAYVIKEMLRIHGLQVKFDPSPDFTDEKSFNHAIRFNFEEVMENLSKKIEVTVKEVQLGKTFKQ